MEWLERLYLWSLKEKRNSLDVSEVFKMIKARAKCEICDFNHEHRDAKVMEDTV